MRRMSVYCRTVSETQAAVAHWGEATKKGHGELYFVFVCHDCNHHIGDNADKVVICEQKGKPKNRIVCLRCFRSFAQQCLGLSVSADDNALKAFTIEYGIVELEALVTPQAAARAYKFRRYFRCPEPVAA